MCPSTTPCSRSSAPIRSARPVPGGHSRPLRPQGVVGEYGGRERALPHAAVEHRLEELLERHPELLHLGLLGVQLEVAPVGVREPRGQVEVVQLVGEPGAREQGEQESPVLGLQLDLLAELTRGGELRVLAVLVAQPGRELDEQPATGVPVLAQAADPLLVVDRQHDDGARVLDHQPAEGLVGMAGPLDDVLAQRHHPVVAVEVAGAQHGPAEVLVSEVDTALGTVERRVARLPGRTRPS